MQQDWKSAGTYGTVGIEFALSIVVGLLGGQWLDKKLGTNGWLTIVGAGLGLAAGVRAVYRVLKRANREADEAERRERAAHEAHLKKYHDDDDHD